MSLENKFQQACQQVRNFTKRPPDADMLEIYAFYKQAQLGDVGTDAKPIDGGVETKRKWDAWLTKKGMSNDAAKEAYILKVNSLASAYA